MSHVVFNQFWVRLYADFSFDSIICLTNACDFIFWIWWYEISSLVMLFLFTMWYVELVVIKPWTLGSLWILLQLCSIELTMFALLLVWPIVDGSIWYSRSDSKADSETGWDDDAKCSYCNFKCGLCSDRCGCLPAARGGTWASRPI